MDPPTAEQLVSAAKEGDLELVQHLLQQGLSVHTTHGNWQDTILHTAAEAGQLRVVEYLVELCPPSQQLHPAFSDSLHCWQRAAAPTHLL